MSGSRRMAAVLALALVLTPLAAGAPLFDPDEGLHAAIAQEMARSGDYITPRFVGEPFLDKPILFFWAEALSLHLFGMNEAAVRIPPLLFGVLGMFAVALLARELFGSSTAVVSSIVYGTMLLPLGVSEVAVHDVAVVPFMCGAAWMIVRVSSTKKNMLVPTFLAGVCLGLSILTKGLVGIVFTGILAACLGVVRRESIGRLAGAFTVATVIAIVVAAPWYVAMERAHPGYLHYYFIERHLRGYLTTTQRHAGHAWWYYVPIVLGGTAPWTGYLAAAARTARADAMRRVLWGWFVFGLVFLSLAESKLVTYVLPLFPALAIIVADFVASGRSSRAGFTILVGTTAALPAIGLVIARVRLGEMPLLLWLPALAAALLVAAGALTLRGRDTSGAFIRRVVWMSICALIGLNTMTPNAASWMTGRDLARALNAAGALPPHVSIVDERIGSVVFYLAPALRTRLTATTIRSDQFAEAIQHIRVDPAESLVAVRNDQRDEFARYFSSPPAPEAVAGTFTLYRTGDVRAALQVP